MEKNLILTKAQNAVLAHDWITAARLYKELLKDDTSNVDYLKELGSIYVNPLRITMPVKKWSKQHVCLARADLLLLQTVQSLADSNPMLGESLAYQAFESRSDFCEGVQ